MIWALADPLRYAREVAELSALTASTPGLTVGDISLSNQGLLTVDVDIEVGDRILQAVLAFPQSFPSIPPTVRPRSGERWSGHQYGTGGELCLEWGPDNWLPTVTGAEMVASAIKLLRTEGGSYAEPAGAVATRHLITVGQEARGQLQRLICTAELRAALCGLNVDADATFSIRYSRPAWRLLVTSFVRDDGAGEWADATIPLPIVEDGVRTPGRVMVGFERLPPLTGKASDLRQHMFGDDAPPPTEDEVLLCVALDGRMAAAYLHNAKDIVFPVMVVQAPTEADRLEPELATLADVRVAIVGCGSLGSKIAVSLARSGVRRFLLIDDDLMLPGNLVRNELTWEAVGLHKVEGVEARIRRVASDVEVVVRRDRLGGQESSGSLDGAVTALQATDLIVDATADTRAFNYAAAAAGSTLPMVWAEVFGGGFGGLVARSRPGLDPTPQAARALIEGWCADRDMPAPAAGNNYDGMVDGQPMVADDATLGLIASIAATVAIDVLVGREPSRFAQSAYMIGMSDEWIFDGPLDTWPIDLGQPAAPVAPADYEAPEARAALESLAAVLRRAKA